MGGGNGQKSAVKRERNAAKAKGKGKNTSQLKVNAAALGIVCQVCRSSFMSNARVELQQHYEAKHSKMTYAQCFPDNPQ